MLYVTNMNSNNGNRTTSNSTTNANNERTLDPVNQVNSTGTPTDSLADLGNNVSSMAAQSVNGLKDKASSIAPGEVVDNVRRQIQSATTGQRDNDGENGEETLNKEDLPDHEELKHIDNMEKEKIMEFLQDKHRSNANIRAGK